MPINLALASAVFILAHRLISGSALRERIVRRVGEKAFQAGFSFFSLLLTLWLSGAYFEALPVGRAPVPIALRVVVLGVSAISCYLVIAGLTTRNPTIAGLGAATRRTDAVHGVIRLTRHPFLVGVVLLTASHLLILHTLADAVFFGTLLLVALTGIPSIDAKRARAYGDDWQVFRRATSIIPGGAILTGRQTLCWSDIGLLRPLLGLVLFALGGALHDI